MKKTWLKYAIIFLAIFVVLISINALASMTFGKVTYQSGSELDLEKDNSVNFKEEKTSQTWPELLDKEEYDKRILALVNYAPPAPVVTTSTSTDESGKIITKMPMV